tara:strand:- start:588 stop:1424 length:837 start_codon:yes stop_codon:yes gene_type:complete
MNKDINQIMALINAYRMDGLGNNFVIIDRRKNALEISKDKIVSIANKKIVPFDQLITLEKEEKNTFPIKIYNPDGIEATACGNGARCVAYLIFQEKKQKNISIKTKERVLSAEVVGKQNVEINMGKPKFGWEEVPLSESMNTKQVNIDLLEKEHGNGFCLNVGNPHIIFFVKDCSKIDIKKLGPKIENYKFFPERINVTFAQVLDKKNIKVNVWERGAGQTKACGTAACAVTVAASIKGLTDKSLQIHFKEGNLQIDYKKEVFMAGPVSEVKKIDLEI